MQTILPRSGKRKGSSMRLTPRTLVSVDVSAPEESGFHEDAQGHGSVLITADKEVDGCPGDFARKSRLKITRKTCHSLTTKNNPQMYFFKEIMKQILF